MLKDGDEAVVEMKRFAVKMPFEVIRKIWRGSTMLNKVLNSVQDGVPASVRERN